MALLKTSATGGNVRSYFAKDHSLQHHREDGAVVDRDGQRMLRVSEDFIIAMARGLEEKAGEQAAGNLMYQAGYRWGMKDQHLLDARMTREFECDFNKMGIGFVLESWWWPYTIGGWGTWRYDFTQAKRGLIFVDLYESMVAKSLGDTGRVACHFYAGLFGATFAGLSKRDLASTEIQCSSTGDDYCRFLVANHERVDAATRWRNEGLSSQEIQREVKDV